MTENFIGGFMSGFLSRGFLGMRVGYRLYLVQRRLAFSPELTHQ